MKNSSRTLCIAPNFVYYPYRRPCSYPGFSKIIEYTVDGFPQLYGQRHAKRDLGTYEKSVDPDQPLRLRRSV